MRIAGVIISLIALVAAGLLFAGYESAKNRIAKLEEQTSSQQQQIAALQLQLKQAREDLLAQGTELEFKLHEIRENSIAQTARLEVQIEQARRGYLALETELEPRIEGLLNNEMQPLKDRVANLETKSTHPLNIAYLNAEEAFTVFTEAVADLRQKALDKQKEKLELQQQYLSGTVSKEEYESRQTELEVELLQAQLNIDIGTIDRMIASPGFADIRHDLERLREEAQPVTDMMRNLVSTVRVGVLDPQEIENRYTQVKNAFTQLDQLLTQAATAKIKDESRSFIWSSYLRVRRRQSQWAIETIMFYALIANLPDCSDTQLKRRLGCP